MRSARRQRGITEVPAYQKTNQGFLIDKSVGPCPYPVTVC